MKNKVKLLSVTMLVMMMVFGMAACGNSTTPNPDPNPDPDPQIPFISITEQPAANILIAEGETETLSVTASVPFAEATIGYQWYKADTYSYVNAAIIDGATEASFDIPSDLTPGDYYYFCEITASGSGGVVSLRLEATKVTVEVLAFGVGIAIAPNTPGPNLGGYNMGAYRDSYFYTITGTGYDWTSYQWYIDGVAQTGNGATTPSYIFNQPIGIYELTVVVTDSAGEKYSGSCRVTVR